MNCYNLGGLEDLKYRPVRRLGGEPPKKKKPETIQFPVC
jgi:hypothetical protein